MIFHFLEILPGNLKTWDQCILQHRKDDNIPEVLGQNIFHCDIEQRSLFWKISDNSRVLRPNSQPETKFLIDTI